MSGVCAVVGRMGRSADPGVLPRMEAAVPHRATGGTERHVEPMAAIARLERAGTPDRRRGLARDPATGVVVAADARLDNRGELVRALGMDGSAAAVRDAVGNAAGPTGNTAGPTGNAAGAIRDGELMAAAYLRWGSGFPERLVGDFALVLWDPRHRCLLLARDPLAMRALYHRVEARRVLAATEVKQVLAVPGVPDEPDERMVAAYLAGCFGSMRWSYYQGVAQVPPGHTVTIGDGGVWVRRYWDVDPSRRIRCTTEEEYAERLRELFLEAVRARIDEDRPVGIFLSGGLDSAAAASAAGLLIEKGRAPGPLLSYSWDFGALTQCDERHLSRHVVDRYGITSRDIPAEDAGPLSGYPDHEPDLDDPFHGHFQTLLDRGFARARDDGVGPHFTGFRGDLLAGPTDVDYETLLWAGRWAGLLDELALHGRITGQPPHRLARRHLLPLVRRRFNRRSMGEWLRAWSGATGEGGASFEVGKPRWIRAELARRVDLPAIRADYGDASPPDLPGPFRRRRYQWIFMPMHLRWAVSHERRAARFGLEAVDAWSDRRLVEYCIALPQRILDRDVTFDKRLVRVAMRGVIPERLRRRARKTVPLPLYDQTLRRTTTPTVRNLLENSRAEARGWLDAAALREDFEAFVAGGRLPPEFWWAISVEWWLRHREGGAAAPAPEASVKGAAPSD